MLINGRPCHALVDTGCEETVIFAGCVNSWDRLEMNMTAVNGSVVRCCGRVDVRLDAQGRRAAVRAVVVAERLMGVDVLLGMTGLEALGGVCVRAGEVRFGVGGDGVTGEERSGCAGVRAESSGTSVAVVQARGHGLGSSSVTGEERLGYAGVRAKLSGSSAAVVQARGPVDRQIETADFLAKFSGGKWTVWWKWANGKEPVRLANTAAQYRVPAEAQEKFDAELQLWINEGWLEPYDEREHGPVRGLIPLMAVIQEAKDKVRPVLDYRELNEHLVPHTAEADVCRDQLRKWRRHGADVAVIDLKKAFLQLHVAPELWPFQTVIVGGQRYALTRVGFGLCIASDVMRAVVREVLDQDPDMANAVLPYADDLLVNETYVSSEQVARHFAKYGLQCKPPERVTNEAGARMLGLRVKRALDGMLRWTRDDVTPSKPPDVLTRRSVFAWAGQLTSHMPVAGWLRPAAAWLKRTANKASDDWDSPIVDDDLRKQVADVARRVTERDPARGQWCVSGESVTVWTDASAIARGVVLSDPDTGGVIEDAAWLRTEVDTDMHINLSELDAALNGVNMAVAWGFTRLNLRTDSVTVQRWLTDALTGRARLRTKAQSEMLIRRRVAVFQQLVTEYGLAVSVELVPSANNRADELTRVPREWLKVKPTEAVGVVAAVRTARAEDIQAVHESVGHQGTRRTLWYARRELGSGAVTKSAVRAVVNSCQVCASIDPAPSRWKHGTLEVDRTWERLAMDVTHFRGKTYLTVIDCGPSRYAMWREIRRSDGNEIVGQLETIFLERGAPAELLMDNATEFKGRELKAFAARWDVNLRYRAAYEPGGNGIIERHHRTIKVMATRQGCTVPEAVHRYNVTPKDGSDIASAPVHCVYRQAGRDLCVQSQGGTSVPTARQPGVFHPGDAVWTRKRGDRCTAVSKEGTVTKIVSPQTIEVDGVPWHVRNVRHRLTDDAAISATDDEGGRADNEIPCPVPTVQAPGRLAIEAPATTPPEPTPTVAPAEQALRAEAKINGTTRVQQTETGSDVKLEASAECQDSALEDERLTSDRGDETEQLAEDGSGHCNDSERPRRGARCRRATQLYGDPIPSDAVE